jgi:hypothetical protein
MTIWNIMWPFLVIWYIFPIFGMLHEENLATLKLYVDRFIGFISGSKIFIGVEFPNVGCATIMDRWGISPHNFAAGRSGAGKIDFNPILSKKWQTRTKR